jgi:hypothetical protein
MRANQQATVVCLLAMNHNEQAESKDWILPMGTNFNSGEQKFLSDNKINNKGPVVFVVFGCFGGFIAFLLLIGMVCFAILDRHTFAIFMSMLLQQTINLGKWVVIGLVAASGAWFAVQLVAIPLIGIFTGKVHFANDHFMGYTGNIKFHDHKDEKNTYNWRGEIGAGEPLLLPPPREDEIPALVRYTDIKCDVPAGHTLLGVGQGRRLETRVFSVLDTCWICGGSKTGKTNTVSLKVEEAYAMGYKFIIVDPHKNKPDSLYNAISGYSDAFLLPVAMTYDQIEDALRVFLTEAQRRIAGGASSEKWILIVDEVGSLTGDKGKTSDQKRFFNLLYNIARMCGQELRGFGMAGWFISQNAVGVAWLRTFAMTCIVHKLLMENEHKVATNNNMAIVREMDNWPRGRCLVHGLDIPEGQIVLQQPLFTPRRIVEAVLPDVTSRLEDLQPNPLTGYVSSVSTLEAALQADTGEVLTLTDEESNSPVKITNEVGSDIREAVKRMRKAGLSHRDIAVFVGLSGRKWNVYQAVCTEENIEQVESEA